MSIFTKYRNPEDQVTSTLMSVLKNSERKVLDKFFEELIEIPAFETIQIINQPGKSDSRPDGEIMSNFQLLIESKTESGYEPIQARHHIESFEKNAQTKIFLLLTKESIPLTEIEKLNNNKSKIVIKNVLWSDIYTFFNDIANDVINFNEKTRFLAQQLTEYFEEIELDKSWKERCVIVPGETALEEAKKYGLSLWAPNKIKRKCGYIAFYDSKKIHNLFKIKCSFIIKLEGSISNLKYFEENAEMVSGKGKSCLPEAVNSLKKLEESTFHKWEFRGQTIIYYFDKTKNLIKNPIEHEKKGPYIQRPSYKQYKDLENAKTTEDIR